jgi:peptide deformylase
VAVREVLKMGHPTLRVKAEPVSIDELKSAEFKQLIQDMFETMEEEDGIGIAAPQIGISKQVAIVGIPNENPMYPEAEANQDNEEEDEPEFEVLVVVNPKITVTNPEQSGFWEGCLSVPGLRGYVERPKAIKVEYTDLEGKPQVIDADGFAATVFQHELDHLDGVLYVDKVTDKSKLSFIDEYLQFVEEVESEEE